MTEYKIFPSFFGTKLESWIVMLWPPLEQSSQPFKISTTYHEFDTEAEARAFADRESSP
jgi:hypothetical protein